MQRLLSEAEAANLLGLSVRALQSRRKHNKGPEFMKNGRSYFYDPDTLQRWISAKTNELPEWRFATQNISIPAFFGAEVESAELGEWELDVKGRLSVHVNEDGQVWMGFTGDNGASFGFECVGFKRDGDKLWSTGDVTIYQIGGDNDVAS